jgi:hypothetical protein
MSIVKRMLLSLSEMTKDGVNLRIPTLKNQTHLSLIDLSKQAEVGVPSPLKQALCNSLKNSVDFPDPTRAEFFSELVKSLLFSLLLWQTQKFYSKK